MKTGKIITLFSVLFLLAGLSGQALAAQPTDLITYFSTDAGNEMVIKWTTGTGAAGTLVVVSEAAITGAPSAPAGYTANPAFGSGDILNAGEFVVYMGTGNMVTVTALTKGTTYYVAAFSYTGTGPYTYETASPLASSAVKRYGHSYDPNVVSLTGFELQCDTCHLKTHFNPDFVPHGDVAYTRCSSCHKAGGLASTKIMIGNHASDGSVDCGSCHNVHNTEDGRIASTDDHNNTPPLLTQPQNNLSYIRKDMTKYIPGASINTVFQQRPAHFAFASSDPAGNGEFNGICQACHKPPVDHHNLTGTDDHKIDKVNPGDDTTWVAKDCSNCHGHTYDSANQDNAFKAYHPDNNFGWDADCMYCHGAGAGAEPVVSVIHNNNCDLCHTAGVKKTADTNIRGLNEHGSALLAEGDAGSSFVSTCKTCHTMNNADMTDFHGLTKADVKLRTRHQISSDLQGGSGYDCESCHSTDVADTQLNTHMGAANDGPAFCASACHNVTTPSKRTGITAKTVIDDATFNAPVNPNDSKCEDCHIAKGDYQLHGLRDDGSDDDGIDSSSFDTSINTVVNHNNLSSSDPTAAGTTPTYTGKLAGAYGGIKVTAYSCDDCHSGDRIDATSLEAMQNHTIRGGASGNCLTCHTQPAFDAVIATGTGISTTKINCEDCHNATINGGGITNSPSGKRMYQYDGLRHHTTSHAQSGDCTWCHADPRPAAPVSANGFACTAVAASSNNGVTGYDTGWETDFGTTCPTVPKQPACRLCHTNYGTDGAGTAYEVNVPELTTNHGYNLTGTATQLTTGLTVWANNYYASRATLGTGGSLSSADPVTQSEIHRIDANVGSSMINVYDYGACLGCHSVQIMHAAPIPTTDYVDDTACNGPAPYDTLLYAPGRSVFNYFRGTVAGTNQWDDHRYSSDATEPYNPCGGFLKSRGKNVYKEVSQGALPWNWGSLAHTLVSPPANANFSNFEALNGMGATYPVPVFADITTPTFPDNVVFISAVWDGTTVTVEATNDDGCAQLSARTQPDGTVRITTGSFTGTTICTGTFNIADITGVTLDIETTNALGTHSTGNAITDTSNQVPVARNNSFTTGLGGTINDTVAGNDTPGEAPNTWAVVAGLPVGEGTLTFNTDGTFTYSAGAFVGATSFTYNITDATPDTSTTATVTITVTNLVPVAVNDSHSTQPATILNADVSLNDTPGDVPNIWAVVTGIPGGEGTLTAFNTNGSYTYDPGAFTGTTSFTYNITDSNGDVSNTATVTISVVTDQVVSGKANWTPGSSPAPLNITENFNGTGDASAAVFANGWTTGANTGITPGGNNCFYTDQGTTGSGSTGLTAGNPVPYVYLESSTGGTPNCGNYVTNDTFWLESPDINAATYTTTLALSFDWNYESNQTSGFSSVDVYYRDGAVGTWTFLQNITNTRSGNTAPWTSTGSINLNGILSLANSRVRIVVTRGGTDFRHDIVFDNINLSGTAPASLPTLDVLAANTFSDNGGNTVYATYNTNVYTMVNLTPGTGDTRWQLVGQTDLSNTYTNSMLITSDGDPTGITIPVTNNVGAPTWPTIAITKADWSPSSVIVWATSTWNSQDQLFVDYDSSGAIAMTWSAANLRWEHTFTGYLTFVAGNATVTSEAASNSPQTQAVVDTTANGPPAFGSPTYTAANATENVAYSSTVHMPAVDPESDPITYSRNGGTCSTWALVNAAGTIAGTPLLADVGTCTVIVQATATGGSDTTTVSITVVAAPSQTQVTYYFKASTGVAIAPGVTTDLPGACPNVAPTGFYIEELSTIATDLCNTDYRWTTTGAVNYSESISNTAFTASTLVTGVDLRITLRDAPGLGVQLFYVTSAGTRVNIGTEVVMTNPGVSVSLLFDLSGQSATAPAGSKLGVRLRTTGVGRVYVGTEDSRGVGFSSGIMNIMQ